MKKIIFLFLFSTTLILMNTTNVSAFTKHIDQYITAVGGCKWHIVGDVDYSLLPPHINSYDVTATDCHGNISHFIGAAYSEHSSNDNCEDFNITSIVIEGRELDPCFVFDLVWKLIFLE